MKKIRQKIMNPLIATGFILVLISGSLKAQSDYLNFFSEKANPGELPFIEMVINENTRGVGGMSQGDFDGDGDLDIVAAGLQDSAIIMFENRMNENLPWLRIVIMERVYNAHSVYSADFDGDGDLDIVAAAYIGTPGVLWLRNDGGSPLKWSAFPVAKNFVNAHEVYACDLDQDNDIDILAASSYLNAIAWWKNDGADTTEWEQQLIGSNVELAKSVRAGDIDGDGDMDVVGVAITAHDILWWENDGGQPVGWIRHTVDPAFIGAHKVELVDMDGDRDIDVLCAGYLGHQVAWWRNTKRDSVIWEKETIGAGVINACAATACDLDGDSDLDVVATAQGSNEVLVWYNEDGLATRWTRSLLSGNLVRPWPLLLCDIDSDSDVDIISASSHKGSEQVFLWQNDLLNPVGNLQKQKQSVQMACYPNPAREFMVLKIFLPKEEDFKIEIRDMNGKMLQSLSPAFSNEGDNYITVKLGALLPGNYQVKIITESSLTGYAKFIRI